MPWASVAVLAVSSACSCPVARPPAGPAGGYDEAVEAKENAAAWPTGKMLLRYRTAARDPSSRLWQGPVAGDGAAEFLRGVQERVRQAWALLITGDEV